MTTAPIQPNFDTPGLLRRARRLADLSQRELAARAGVSPNTVARVELGENASTDTVVRLFAAAGMRLGLADRNGRAL